MNEVTEHRATAERLVESWAEDCSEYSTTFPDDGEILIKRVDAALADAFARGRDEATAPLLETLAEKDMALAEARSVEGKCMCPLPADDVDTLCGHKCSTFPAPVEAPAVAETPLTVEDTKAELRVLRQQIEDTIAVAETESDKDGFISAYHFKTGAIHRLLAEARKGDSHIIREAVSEYERTHDKREAQEVLSEFKRDMEEKVIPEIENALYERNVLAEEARHRIMKPSGKDISHE